MIQEDFIDTYSNVTLDSIFALKFVLDWRWDEAPKFVFLGDDDSYVNIPQLWETFMIHVRNGRSTQEKRTFAAIF